MGGSLKVDRARRNALKAGGLALGALLAASALPRQASAKDGNNGNGNGGCGNGQQTNGCGGSGGNCFAAGTLVRTRDGYRPVETLAAGDEVAVRSGGFAPIRAMVSHTLNRVAGTWDGNPDNLPVVIRRGALGENAPSADLCVTALHAVYVDGFLMNAGDLVNGTSISFKAADGQDSLDFFNIELDGHEILDVQGASFESLHRVGMERCAPLLGFDGGRSKLRSHLRSVASVVVDRRRPIDVIRDTMEERGIAFARAA